jgi:hypothetical protein
MTFSSGVINVRSGQVIDKAEILENNISGQITDAAIEVHKILGGPGLLEGVYEESLCQQLNLRGLNTQRQICLPIE